MKNLTGKKAVVLRDELNITGGGLYCIMPYETLDRKGNAIFKVGLALDFNKRMEQYHTYFSNGVYYDAFLQNPPVRTIETRNKPLQTKTKLYLEIEKFIIDDIVKNGGKRIYSTTRIKNKNDKKEGSTEWIYTNEDTIHRAFLTAEKKYGGQSHLFYLDGLDPTTGKLTSINDDAKTKEKQTPLYVGKIIYKR
jgi:hypothetical protein